MRLALFLVAVQPGPTLVSPTPSPTPVNTFAANPFHVSFLLSTLIWLPVLAALIIAALPNPRGRNDRTIYLLAFWTNASLAFLALVAYNQAQLFSPSFQFEELIRWVPWLGISYHLGADGITIAMLLVGSLIGTVSVLASASIRERVREYFTLLLLLQASITGALCARDMFVFVLFWAAGLLPAALLLAGWGGPRRHEAAIRFLTYGAVGTAALLVALLLVYAATGGASFDMNVLANAALTPRVQLIAGLALVIAAATRLPLVPFQGWVRDALSEAPPGLAVMIAGIGMRLGGFMLLRLLISGLHDGSRLLAPLLGALAGITILYAALAAFRNDDVRKFGAYLAIIPGGLFALGMAGLTSISLLGAAFGLITGGLAAALAVGVTATIAERAQSRSLSVLAGLAPRMPKLAWLLVLAGLAVIGVPGMASFISEVFTFLGVFYTQPAAAFLAGLGMAAAVAVVAFTVQRVLFGRPRPDSPGASDASLAETWYLGLLVAALLWFGILPGGPKIGGQVTLFDEGIVNVLSNGSTDVASPYVPPAPPAPPTPSPSPSPSTSASPSASPGPSPSPSP